MEKIFILFQHILPQQLLSRLTGWLANLRHPIWLKNWVIQRFVGHFDVDMSEAREPDCRRYPHFNDFFTRPLLDGARPISDSDVVCPADGVISQIGSIDHGLLFQAKGKYFSALDLLGGDMERARCFHGGQFATIYLSPRDYHRVHMPLSGKLAATTYVPGRLFSVNGVTAENVDRLFARNERLVCYFDTEIGPVAQVLVGAMIVAGIATVWCGRVAPPPRAPLTLDYRNPPESVALEKGMEMGRFFLGSTVITLFPPGAIAWEKRFAAGSAVRMGEELARFAGARDTEGH